MSKIRLYTKKTRLLILSALTLISSFISGNLIGQVTTTYPFTGSTASYTVPPCVSSITVTVAGADGGGPSGGNGAVITATIPVNPGDVLTMNAGGSGGLGAGGYGGGGIGYATAAGAATLGSYGGGGSSSLFLNGTPVIIAAGGGGTGGGTVGIGGGGGGCATGIDGLSTYGAGGTGGSQVAGGAGGTPWAGTPPGGSPGSLGQGGQGGFWFDASGGGGGGGYYGGGGGGNDGCCTGANGGGGGGGGSSLVPPGAGCNPASNNGAGYISITALPGISASNTGAYCVGEMIQLNATAGASSYSWTGPNGFTSSLQNPTIPAASLTDAGTYSVVGTGVGCLDPSSTIVVVVAPPTPSAGTDFVLCSGLPISLNGTQSQVGSVIGWTHNTAGINPVPNVIYTPNALNIDPNVNVNQPGLYSFILSENNGTCPVVMDTVQVLVSITTHTTSNTSPTCPGYSDGTITINNPNAVEYSYNNGVTYVLNSTQGGFPAGTYTVRSRNQYGCIFVSTVTIVDGPPLLISAGNDTLVCQNGTANLWASTSQPGLAVDYHWSHNSDLTANTTISPLANTIVFVYAEAPGGCLSDTTEVNITVREPITGLISPFDTICPGYPTTIGVNTFAGGIGAPYDIVWSTGETSSGISMDISVNPPTTTTYTATITDGCESTPLVMSTEVFVAPVPVPLMAPVPGLCEPAQFELINTTDPSMVESFTWNISDGQTYTDTNGVLTEEMMFGTYSVQLIVTSPQGCIDSVWFNDWLVSYQFPQAEFSWSPNPVQMFNTEVHFSNQSFLAAQNAWTFESGEPMASTLELPTTTFPLGFTGEYLVTLFVTSENGCVDSVSHLVPVLPEVLIYAPNTFTPDGDEFNQKWRLFLEGVDVTAFSLEIYNRWGEMIWESKDIEVGWDGTYDGTIAPQGTYTWKATARDSLTDKKYLWTGHMNILK